MTKISFEIQPTKDNLPELLLNDGLGNFKQSTKDLSPYVNAVNTLLTKSLDEVNFSSPETCSYVHFSPGNPG